MVRGGLRGRRGLYKSLNCTQRAGERAATAEIRGEARGEQRTANMKFMSVTREVSQPEMSALKLRKL